MDRSLFLTWLMLVGFGLVMIASASSIKAHNEFVTASGRPDDYWYLIRQSIWIGISTVALLVFSQIDYRKLRFIAFPALFMVIGLLAAVFLPVIGGPKVLGAQRWLDIGGQSLQPSELTKIALAIYLAAWLERKGKEVKDFQYGFLPFVFVLSIIITLLYFQEDLGTTVIICIMAVAVFFISGAHIGQLAFGGLIGLLVVAGLITARPFRQARIDAWLNPGADPTGIGYHVTQARYTIGSGGLFGLGYGHSLQKYEYIPHAPTDSIFAIICEELGLIGGFVLIGLYLLLLYRMITIAHQAPDNFGRLLASGIAVWIGIQAFINMGGLLRIIPLTGVPLPFISYGGSSLLMCSIGIGIVLSISKHMKQDKKSANRVNWRRDRGTSRASARSS